MEILLIQLEQPNKSKHKSTGNQKTLVVQPHPPPHHNIGVVGLNIIIGATSESHNHASSGPSNNQIVIEVGNMVIKFEVLKQITSNFNEANVLGSGDLAKVYKGQFKDGTVYVVKRIGYVAMDANKLAEFKYEIECLKKVQHRHLVPSLAIV